MKFICSAVLYTYCRKVLKIPLWDINVLQCAWAPSLHFGNPGFRAFKQPE